MKKIITLIIAVFSMATIIKADNDKIIHFKAVQVNYVVNNSWVGWENCNIDVELHPEKHKLYIFSRDIQIIDYGTVQNKNYNTYSYLHSYGTNTYYNDIKVEWYFYNSGSCYIKLTTSDLLYKYRLILIDD